MRTLLGVAIAAVVLASASPAMAGTDIRYQTAQGGVVCKPTNPGSTGVVAKATGLRNEGTVNTTVICGFESSNSRSDFGTIQSNTMGLYGLNGASKTVSCTAVNGFANGSPIYATKTITTDAGGASVLLNYDASDFGGTAGDPLPASDYWSITCTLPGNTSIGYMRTQFTVNTPAV
jgi:hypothetical protein